MATKYTIQETAHTEESAPFTSKGKAVEAAEAAAEEYPGTTFIVATAKGTIVHKALAESVDVVDEPPVDDVPDAQVNEDDGEFEPEADQDADEEGDPFTQALAEVAAEGAADDEEDAGEEADADEDGSDQEDADGQDEEPDEGDAQPDQDATPTPAPAPVPVAAPKGAELELCAANTNAKRMHYRTIGVTRTACGSASTSRRANAHQIETASLCPNCEKLAEGKTVDTRPAGAARGTGSRRKPKQLIMDAGEIRDLVAHLKQGLPYSMELTDGTRVDVVGGDPQSKELDEPDSDKLSDVRSINIVSA